MEHDPLSAKPPLRIGLLVDSELGSKYVYDFAKWANAQSGFAAVTQLIIQGPSDKPKNRLCLRFASIAHQTRALIWQSSSCYPTVQSPPRACFPSLWLPPTSSQFQRANYLWVEQSSKK
jgi:hypothetical protein